MTPSRLILLVVLAAFGTAAHAQSAQAFYRWTDAGGVTHYGDAAPAGANATRVLVSTRGGTAGVAAGAGSTVGATSSPASTTADDARLQSAEAAARQRNCSRARANLQTLSGNAMLVDSDDASAAHRMSPEAVAEARKVAQANSDTYCGEISQ